MFNYRPQTNFAKVIFSQASVGHSVNRREGAGMAKGVAKGCAW